jgi:hypothetical protein
VKGLLFVLALAACGSSSSEELHVVARNLPVALTSVWGTSANDVYAVGGNGTVYHYDGAAWTKLPTNETANLWWIFGVPNGPIYVGGDGGLILRKDGDTFTRMQTPNAATVFGIWGTAPDDVWAVGGSPGGASGGFAWRLAGDRWEEVAGFPPQLAATAAMWKVFGRSRTDAWIVGTNGTTLRWDGALTLVDTGIRESLFTVHADRERYVTVGGFGTGLILETTGSTWTSVGPPDAPALIGVCVTDDHGGYAVGQDGAIWKRDGSSWRDTELGAELDETFHSVWVDPAGGVWAAGGQVLTLPLVDGIMVYVGDDPPTTITP